MDARAGVGLPPGGPGGRSGLVSGGLSPEGAALSGAGFLRTDVDLLLLLADNCHRDFLAEFTRPSPVFDPVGCGLALPGRPSIAL